MRNRPAVEKLAGLGAESIQDSCSAAFCWVEERTNRWFDGLPGDETTYG